MRVTLVVLSEMIEGWPLNSEQIKLSFHVVPSAGKNLALLYPTLTVGYINYLINIAPAALCNQC